MNYELIEKELLCVQKLNQNSNSKLKMQLNLYEKLFRAFSKLHNISHFQELEIQIIDSLKVLDLRDLSLFKSIIDLGSGAGFPALFLALFLKAHFHLFEPNTKKYAFLHLVKSELELENISLYKSKIQEYKVKFKAELIISRALAKSEQLIRFCEGFFDEKSLFLFYKGSNFEKESENFNFAFEIIEFRHRKYCFIKAEEFIKDKNANFWT